VAHETRLRKRQPHTARGKNVAGWGGGVDYGVVRRLNELTSLRTQVKAVAPLVAHAPNPLASIGSETNTGVSILARLLKSSWSPLCNIHPRMHT
jgi:hypothetical protein